MAVVKLREKDRKILDNLASAISKVKGKASKSEVLGLSLSFAEKNLDDFLASGVADLKDETVLQIIGNPANGDMTDARRVKQYLYA